MANTVGLDGFIVIGYDETAREFHPVAFSDCKLGDTAHLPDLINKSIDRAFDIRYYPITVLGHVLNVLHIPPSFDKPHVIRLHRSWLGDKAKEEKHKIFVRKNTKIEEANKYDFDFMYYDRKNVVPDYAVYGYIHKRNSDFTEYPGERVLSAPGIRVMLDSYITLENVGRRPFSIKFIEWKIKNAFDSSFANPIIFTGHEKLGNRIILKSQELSDNVYELNGFFGGQSLPNLKAFLNTMMAPENLQLSMAIYTTNNVLIRVLTTQFN